MKSVCEHMMTSKQIQNLLSLLLAVGNFLNGGKKEFYQERSMDCVTRSISHYKDDKKIINEKFYVWYTHSKILVT